MAEYISFQPSDFFNTTLYSGTGSSQAVTGVGFSPDFSWLKLRTSAQVQCLTDTVRGVTNYIQSNSDAGETTNVQTLTDFDSDGFTIGTDDIVSKSSNTAASWNWKAGTTSGITTNGYTTITPSDYSFDATRKISIVKYTGNATSGAKVAHGLGVAPEIMLVKRLDTAAAWAVYSEARGNTKNLKLNTNAAENVSSGYWNDTTPDSVNFTLGNNTDVNNSGTAHVAYCFASKKGFSKLGSYVGNNGGTDGVFVYTGFKPSLVIQKAASAGNGEWLMRDNKRNTYNPTTATLNADTNFVEFAGFAMDILSNGFKTRADGADQQDSGVTYIYMAFAAFPLVSSNDVPVVAR